MTEPQLSDLVGRLTADSPQLRAALRSYLESDLYEPGLEYVEAGMLATALVNVGRVGSPDLTAFFARLDRVLVEADEMQRKVLVVGLLESLQSQLMNLGQSIEQWGQLLGPVAQTYWGAVAEMWTGDITPTEFNRILDR